MRATFLEGSSEQNCISSAPCQVKPKPVKRKNWACLVPKNFLNFPSHQIFGRMHETLNINKK
jgi:hypothetical protein